MKRTLYTADFETTTDPNDCRVWAWGVCNISNPNEFFYGTIFNEFFDWLYARENNSVIYFHNLKFDGQFILSWLLNHNFTYISDKREPDSFTFSSLISDMGMFYAIEIWFPPKPGQKKLQHIKIYDSLKLLNFKVKEIAESFHLPIHKGEIDYEKPRPIGYQPTDEEIAYLKNDVQIMAMALYEVILKQGLTKMTIASNALNQYRSMIPNFQNWFPVLDSTIDRDIRKSYRGGWTYLNPVYRGQTVGAGLVLDRNSMYPAIMTQEILPFGFPDFYEGLYQPDSKFPLFIQSFVCKFRLRPGKLPTIQIKNSPSFIMNEWLESSNDEIVSLTLCKPDFELFLENYKVEEFLPVSGWKFHAVKGIFDKYIFGFSKQKVEAKKSGDHAAYITAKLLMNSLYGKLGTNPLTASKIPYLDEKGIVSYMTSEQEEREPLYIPMATFITSYARTTMIRTSQKIRDYGFGKYGYDTFIYSDTDSAHCLLQQEDLSNLDLEIDSTKLGAWDMEMTFDRGRYLRQKCYIEESNGEIFPHVAGLPEDLAKYLNFDNFDFGFTTASLPPEVLKQYTKLRYQRVPGGVILAPTDFTIK